MIRQLAKTERRDTLEALVRAYLSTLDQGLSKLSKRQLVILGIRLERSLGDVLDSENISS